MTINSHVKAICSCWVPTIGVPNLWLQLNHGSLGGACHVAMDKIRIEEKFREKDEESNDGLQGGLDQ